MGHYVHFGAIIILWVKVSHGVFQGAMAKIKVLAIDFQGRQTTSDPYLLAIIEVLEGPSGS